MNNVFPVNTAALNSLNQNGVAFTFPPTLFPSTTDGKPITQRGMESWMWWSGMALAMKNQRMMAPLRYAAAGALEPYCTNLKNSFQKIIDGELDPTTGWMWLAPGEVTRIMHPRWWQSSGHPTLREGDWAISCDVRQGDTINFAFGGWMPNGDQLGIAMGTSTLVSGGAAITGDRYRFIRNLTSADTNSPIYLVTGGASGGWYRYWYGGMVSDEASWQADPWRDDWTLDAAQEKIWRIMDPQWTNDARIGRADDMIRHGDYIVSGNAGSWAAPLPANNDLRRAGADIGMWAIGATKANSTLHICIPPTLGAHITANVADGFYSANAKAGISSAGYNAYRDAMLPLWPQIFAAAEVEYRKLADQWVDELIAKSWPDTKQIDFDVGSELWNPSFIVGNRYCWILEYYLRNRTTGGNVTRHGNSTRGGGGAGYLCNLIAVQIAKSIAAKKPNQRWRIGLCLQTNTPPTEYTALAIQGWNLYIADNPADSLPISKFGGWTADYLSDVHKWTNKSAGVNNNMFDAATEQEHAALYINEYQTGGQQAIFAKGVAWMLNQNSGGSSVHNILRRTLAHKATLEAAGAVYYGGYEGSDHNDIGGSQILPNLFDAATGQQNGVINLMKAWVQSPEAELVFKTYLGLKLAADPNASISNYYKYTSLKNWGGNGPWFEKHMGQLGIDPTVGVAAAFFYYSRQGQGLVPLPSQPPATPPPVYDDDTSNPPVGPLVVPANWRALRHESMIEKDGRAATYYPISGGVNYGCTLAFKRLKVVTGSTPTRHRVRTGYVSPVNLERSGFLGQIHAGDVFVSGVSTWHVQESHLQEVAGVAVRWVLDLFESGSG